MEAQLVSAVVAGFESLYGKTVEPGMIQVQKTRKEFEGDLTVVVFPLLRFSGQGPEQTGEALGNYLNDTLDVVANFNVVKGFLNIAFTDTYWLNRLKEISGDPEYGTFPSTGETHMVEYSSPNTNKPLHLGHLRNIFLGYSVSNILKANGHEVVKVQIINDRGIHICKSMLAWQRYGNGETPESTGMKGDKFVGKYYVEFDKHYQLEIAELVEQGMDKEEAKKRAPLILEAQEMLKLWESGDSEIVALWKKMNGWVYDGFDATYKTMGVDFDKLYYESDTYVLGKEHVLEGLSKDVFYQKDDQSVWCDLEDRKLDHKLVLRSDGTSVYMTQDIGTAIERFKDYPNLKGIVYTVGNEQDYHFKVLFAILDKLGYGWAKKCYHLSYGMVELPKGMGRMKSREGTVVDADDLMADMVEEARESAMASEKLEAFGPEEKEQIIRYVGLGALKYFLLKVEPKKKMVFNPKESIELQGHTGPFIQYAYARSSSLLSKAGENIELPNSVEIHEQERALVKCINEYPEIVKEAGEQYSPALIANYVYELAKLFNQFYQAVSVTKETDAGKRHWRLALCGETARVIKSGMDLLGIDVPERM